MSKLWKILRRERTRAYLYRSLVAAGPLAVTYGLLSGQEVAVWLGAAGVWLGGPVLAAANTSTKRQEED